MTVLYKADKDPKKVDLGVGAYRTDEGKPYVFNVVKKAEESLYNDIKSDKSNKEYQSSEGNPDFGELSKKVVFGEDLYKTISKKVATTQALGGTGAIRIAADFLCKFSPCTVYVPNPTWSNHNSIFKDAHLKAEFYPYYNGKTRSLDFEAMIKKFNELPDKSVILLHACAHNPTGVDPSPDQWKKIAEVFKKKNHYPFFDNAYQGFASGDLNKDAFSIRYFVEQGFQMIVTQSYSKTMGLYGERAGALHVLCESDKTAENVMSQLRICIRTNYSNPPLHPLRLVLNILSNSTLYKEWCQELKDVAERIIQMRKELRDELERLKVPGDWSHITSQIGMFSYTGLSESQSKRMIEKHHVYMLKNGRISMSGLNFKNIKYVAQAIKYSIEEED